tara:strand:+ start:1579 stop:2022 length:444 start_codon:yes stop_codon:yes gene_type:complete
MSGLKLTKAAILALLKKKRKVGQIFEAGANRKKGTLERAHLKRDFQVRSMQGTGNKPHKPSDVEKQQFQSNEMFMDSLDQGGASKVVAKYRAKNRKQLLKLVKRFRAKGGKLSEYKGKNKVYAEVKALRKAKADYKEWQKRSQNRPR